MEKTKYVAFSTQKGGAGKTTLTVLVASYLHYVKGFNVAIIDCDHPQYSISGIRSRDAEASVKDAHYKKMAFEQIKKLNKKPYPVTKSKAEDALEVAEKMKAKHPTLDFIFFDLPGTANNNDVICLVSKMNHIFTPIIADRVVLTSSIGYAKTINEAFITIGRGNVKSIHLVWNMVDGREKTELYDTYEKVFAEHALSVLKTFCQTASVSARRLPMREKRYFALQCFPQTRAL